MPVFVWLLSVVATLAFSSPAAADPAATTQPGDDGGVTPATETVAPPPTRAEPQPDLDALARRVSELEGRSAAASEPPREPPVPASNVVVRAAPGKGFTVSTLDDRFSVTMRLRLQLRDTFTDGPTVPATNELNVKTLRLVTHGHVLDKALRYSVQLAFGGNDYDVNASPILDAYVEHVGLRDLNVRVGQYFVPFDRARTMREFALEMVDRPFAARELALDRDIGIMASSDDFLGTKVVGYRLFAGGGEGRNRFGGERPGPLGVVRLILRPWGMFDDDIEGDLARDDHPRLAIGVGAAYNRLTNRPQSTYGTAFTLGQVDYMHGAVDAIFKMSGFSLLAEGLIRRSSDEHLDAIVAGAPKREYAREGHAYLVQTGMMLTSQVQLVGRWEQVFARRGTDPQLTALVDTQGNQLGGGANLYLNGHAFKVQADYFVLFGDAPDQRHVVRLQLDASF